MTQHTRSHNQWPLALLAFAILAAGTPSLALAQTPMRTRPRRPQNPAKNKVDKFKDRVVTFDTSDGVTIEADWYPVKIKDGEKTPAAILIHMYPAQRSSWKPMVPLLRDRLGIALLAYDIRGTGGSIEPAEKELEKGYQGPDPAHFADAWKDAEAAFDWLGKQSHIDTERVILIGASVGCSISIDYAHREPKIQGVACLSPGADYMAIDTLSHIKDVKNAKVLLIAPKGEYDAVEAIMNAGKGKAKIKGKQYPGGRENHGTRMFDADYGTKVKERLMQFARGVLKIEKGKKGEKDD